MSIFLPDGNSDELGDAKVTEFVRNAIADSLLTWLAQCVCIPLGSFKLACVSPPELHVPVQPYPSNHCFLSLRYLACQTSSAL